MSMGGRKEESRRKRGIAARNELRGCPLENRKVRRRGNFRNGLSRRTQHRRARGWTPFEEIVVYLGGGKEIISPLPRTGGEGVVLRTFPR